jgi:hypothetical protein
MGRKKRTEIAEGQSSTQTLHLAAIHRELTGHWRDRVSYLPVELRSADGEHRGWTWRPQ